MEVDINVIPVEDADGDDINDGKIAGIEKCNQSLVDIQPKVRQGDETGE